MLPAHTHVVPEPTLARAQSQADTLSACPSHASSARTPRAGPPNTMQLYRTLFVFLAVVLAMAAAEEAAPDPCLAEDYAEVNYGTCCAQGGYKKEGHGYAAFSVKSVFDLAPPCPPVPHPWLACSGREICRSVGPKVKAKKEL